MTMSFYDELADWWPLLSPPEEYEEEAALYERALLERCDFSPKTLLELGSGGGNNASYLKKRFEMVLVDLSPGMLEVSRALNPECEHHQGDMRTARLDRIFDCVFIHDAIDFMATEDDLRQALETAYLHCEPGGAALFAPDHVRENFRVSTDCGGHDGESRSLRYLEWTWDPDPTDDSYVTDYAIVMREGSDLPRVELDRHTGSLFERAVWLRLLTEVGFQPEVLPLELSDLEPGSHEIFACRKPK